MVVLIPYVVFVMTKAESNFSTVDLVNNSAGIIPKHGPMLLAIDNEQSSPARSAMIVGASRQIVSFVRQSAKTFAMVVEHEFVVAVR